MRATLPVVSDEVVTPPRSFRYAFRAILLVGLGAAAFWIYSAQTAESEEAAEPQDVMETIKAPIDVTQLPYYSDSWTFERDGNSVTVRTNLYMDDEGRGFATTVCRLTLYSVEGVENVAVEGANGAEFCP